MLQFFQVEIDAALAAKKWERTFPLETKQLFYKKKPAPVESDIYLPPPAEKVRNFHKKATNPPFTNKKNHSPPPPFIIRKSTVRNMAKERKQPIQRERWYLSILQRYILYKEAPAPILIDRFILQTFFKVKNSFILYSQQNLHFHRWWLYQRSQRKIKIFKTKKKIWRIIYHRNKFPFLKKTIAPNMRTCFYLVLPSIKKTKKPLCDDHESILPIFSIQFIKNPLSTNQIYWSFAYKHTKLKKIYVLWRLIQSKKQATVLIVEKNNNQPTSTRSCMWKRAQPIAVT